MSLHIDVGDLEFLGCTAAQVGHHTGASICSTVSSASAQTVPKEAIGHAACSASGTTPDRAPTRNATRRIVRWSAA